MNIKYYEGLSHVSDKGGTKALELYEKVSLNQPPHLTNTNMTKPVCIPIGLYQSI